MNQMVTAAERARTYVLSVPASYDKNTPLPLSFGFHGNFGNGNAFKNGESIELATGQPAIFVYPDGLESNIGGSGWELDVNGRDVALFDAIFADLSSRYCIDQDRVTAFGRSFGAFFTNTLACARGDRLAAVAAMMGGGPNDQCTAAVHAWLHHSADDPTVSIDDGRESRDHYLALNGCGSATHPIDPAPCVEYDDCSSGRRVVWCENATGGHTVAPYANQAVRDFFLSVGSRR